MHTDKTAENEIFNAIRAWNSASITLLDIRHSLIAPENALHSYRLPTSAFIYTSGGSAEVLLNDTSYCTNRFGLFHGGKGAELTIVPRCEWLEYYMVLYKAQELPSYRGDSMKRMPLTSPFRQQYGFAPANPVFFSSLLRQMYEKWKGPTPLNRFYGKSAFYQLVYEIYEELERGHVRTFEPDVVAMAARYLDKHYTQPIVIQEVCDMLGVSYSHFHRSFKQHFGQSPQDYLICTRLHAARALLNTSHASIREIAAYCGFQDERNLQRMFSKHMGLSPNVYRQNASHQMRDGVLGKLPSFSYNEDRQVSLDELREKGASSMFKQARRNAVVAAALCLMLLSACSAPPATTNGTTASPTPAVITPAPQAQTTMPAEEGTKTISTVMGDVEVPTNPKRIVVDYLIGDVVSLGVVPVGVSKADYAGPDTAFSSHIAGSASVGEWDLEPEAVMGLEPDLIILAFSQSPYEDLSKIAPTVFVPYGEMSTEERISFIGEVLNRTEEAEKTIAAYKEKIQQGKQKLADAGLSSATVTIGQFNDNGSYIAGAKHAVGVAVYNELGLAAPEKIQSDIIDKDEYWGNISMEVLESYCGDYIITLNEVTESVEKNAIWQLIPAVKDSRIMSVDTAISWYTDIMSASALVDMIVDGLIAASK